MLGVKCIVFGDCSDVVVNGIFDLIINFYDYGDLMLLRVRMNIVFFDLNFI